MSIEPLPSGCETETDGKTACAQGRAVSAYLSFHSDDQLWTDAFKRRMAIIEAGQLSAKVRTLVFTAGLFINGDIEAAREYAQKARAAGAGDRDIKLMTRILEFYQGLKLQQDAQKVVSFWCEGHFPTLREAEEGQAVEILTGIEQARGYVANGFRVYGADGEWLHLYLQRSSANREYGDTLNFGEVQLLSFAITLKNHGYSGNFNDGCISVHEKLAKSNGFENIHILETIQILELVDAISTSRRAEQLLA